MPVTYVTGGGGATLSRSAGAAPGRRGDRLVYFVEPTGAPAAPGAPPTSIDRVFHFLLVTVNGSTVTVAPTDEHGRTFDVQTYTFG